MPQKTEDTPMMIQYKAIKADYPDAFLFYRLGDFYEMFYEDAVKASQILELTLTARNKNADEPIPMCGVPYHSATNYIDTLTEKGYKVAICEQVEDPKQAKGMVKREVVQLVSPGTVTNENSLEAKENNYLSAVYEDTGKYYLTYVDLSTGELKATVLNSVEALSNELAAIQSKELIVEDAESETVDYLTRRMELLISTPRTDKADKFDLDPYVEEDNLPKASKTSLQILLNYVFDTQMRSLTHIQTVDIYETDHYLKLGPGARKNLELQSSLKDNTKQGTLLWLLDETKTAMGGRLLKQWLDKPLIERTVIEKRQNLVGNIINHFFERADLKEALTKVYDLERLAGRIAFQAVNARDLIQLKDSLDQVPQVINLLEMMNEDGLWDDLIHSLDPNDDINDLISSSIKEEPPISITEGGIIKDGYNDQLDVYLDAIRNGKQWIAELQKQERETTGINNLKIGYNKVFGYYIEITKANIGKLDEDRYERKQTLANSERYITPELKEKESLILEAEEKSQNLEYTLFVEIREKIKEKIQNIQKLANIISQIDVLQSFAEVSERYQFTKPRYHSDSQSVNIEEGRHPVVEKVMGDQSYVPNDVVIDDETDVLLITGPNMSGKSTYMRQLALIVIMGQMGCFVPAKSAELPLFDQIFTRIGAMDDLIGGQSTFMVEMMEANVALEQATSRSLLLFDEIGRGTATFDGMALAEAIIEYIHDTVHAKTLFSTHYHELTALDNRLERLKNIHVGAREQDDDLVFLYKIEDGPADESYGVQVAKLAGLPDEVIEQAKIVLQTLEANHNGETFEKPKEEPIIEESEGQLQLFDMDVSDEERDVLKAIRQTNLMNLTPLEAMNAINEWKERIN